MMVERFCKNVQSRRLPLVLYLGTNRAQRTAIVEECKILIKIQARFDSPS